MHPTVRLAAQAVVSGNKFIIYSLTAPGPCRPIKQKWQIPVKEFATFD